MSFSRWSKRIMEHRARSGASISAKQPLFQRSSEIDQKYSSQQSVTSAQKETLVKTKKPDFDEWSKQLTKHRLPAQNQVSNRYPTLSLRASPRTGVAISELRDKAIVQQELDSVTSELNALEKEYPSAVYSALSTPADLDVDVPMLGPVATGATLQKEVADYSERKAALQKKQKALNEEIAAIDTAQQLWAETQQLRELTDGYDPEKDREAGQAGWDAYQAYVTEKAEAVQTAKEEETFWEKMGRWYSGSHVDTSLPLHIDANQLAQGAQQQESKKRIPQEDWTEEQKLAYGYLWQNTRSKAGDYAYSINSSRMLKEELEQLQAIREDATSSPGGAAMHTVGAILAAPFGLADYLGDIISQSSLGYIPETDGQVTPFEYSQAVTGAVSQDLNDKYGTLNEDVPVIGGKGWGDVYGLGTGIAQSTLAAYAGGPGQALVQFFGSSAASGIDDALSRGATGEQAILYGTMLGAADGVAEMIGVDNLFKLGSASTFRQLFWNLIKQGAAEGIEEGVTSVLNHFADNLVMRDKSNFYVLTAQYMTGNGMSEENAKRKAWRKIAEDTAYETLAGSISGMTHAAGQTTAVDTTNQTNYDNRNEQGGVANADTQGRTVYPGRVQWNTQDDSQGKTAGGQANGSKNAEGRPKSGIAAAGDRGELHTADSEGRTLSLDQANKLQGTAITDSNGAPLAVYHVTDNMEFTTFEKGDTGFHFGSAKQAANHSKNRGYSNGRTFRVYLDIKNPVQTHHDIMGWTSKGTALYLWSEGVLTDAEFYEIDSLWKNGDGYDADSAVRLRAILESKGYDGIVYPNDFEGVGKSYMAFHDDQIIRSEIVPFGVDENALSNAQDRRSFVLQRLDSMDMQTVDPRTRILLREYGRHLQQLRNIESLQSKLRSTGDDANAVQLAERNLAKLEQLYARHEQRLTELEKNPRLQRLAEQVLTEFAPAELENVQNSQNEDVDIIRTYDKIKASGQVITDGSHLEDGKLKPNVTYECGEHEYLYQTDGVGHICRVIIAELKEKIHAGRLAHNKNTYGKQAGDHAGHLVGDRFGGSPELDNLVSQAALVNLSKYKKIENQWAKAIKKGKHVSVDITVNYDGGPRPTSFDVTYRIDGIKYETNIPNQ